MSELPLKKLTLAANAIRTLSMDAVQAANSGHPGMPMGTADLGIVLWTQILRHNPSDPNWPDRDRFVLSAGHGSMLLYSLLHLTGYDLPMEEIRNFRQWGSKTPGHPEFGHTAGVETTTGPLGQGVSNAVGMALAERMLAARYNRPKHTIVDHYTYTICSDGDLMEGVAHESGALAGHLGLGKLIALYDANSITIDGSTDLSMTEDVGARYVAYGWHVLEVDGHDMAAVAAGIEAAKAVTDKPSMLICRTHIGYGSPNKQDTSNAHGSPLGAEEIALTKQKLGWPELEPFELPAEVYEFVRGEVGRLSAEHASWQTRMSAYEAAHPELAAEFKAAMTGELPFNWQQHMPQFEAGGSMATRNASGAVLKALVPNIPTLIGGSADLTGSNKTIVDGMGFVTRDDYSKRYINYGVREHGMGAVMNGMSLHGGLRPYAGTFLIFSDYLRPSMRLAALMHQPIVYVLTHDGIGVGEDGPTHQPIEQTMSLRLIPNLRIFRPADANETSAAWQAALEHSSGPTALALTRQKLPVYDGPTHQAVYGGYVLRDHEAAIGVLLASGSEVQQAVEAHDQLLADGIPTRVVSLPCWSLFEEQSADYRASVLPAHLTARVAIDAGATLGWERYTGSFGRIIGLDRFGASAPFDRVYQELGITTEAAVAAMKQLLA